MKKRGIAKKSFRADGARKWDAAERMHTLTDSIIDEMGGNSIAAKQAESYKGLIDNIKGGSGTTEATGSLAEAARKRMIDRERKKVIESEKQPDIGKDKAKRRAYPGRN